MKLVISEKQLNELLSQLNHNVEITEQGDGDGAPEAGTSSDGEQKTGASKWESGVTRGPANQIGVTKWADSYKITRGRANPLSEQINPPKSSRLQMFKLQQEPTAGSDYFASLNAQNKRKIDAMMYPVGGTKHIYRSDDGNNLFVNLINGNIPGALLDLREILQTDAAIVTEIAISVIFSETVVVPIAIVALNAIVLLNDLYLLEYQGGEDENSLVRVLEDLFILGSMGAVRIGQVGLKRWLANTNNLRKLVKLKGKLKPIIDYVKKLLSGLKIPQILQKFIQKTIGLLEKLYGYIDELLKKQTPAVAKGVATISKGVAAGFIGLVGIKALNRLLGLDVNSTEIQENPEQMLSGLKLTQEKKDYLVKSQTDIESYRKSGNFAAVAKKIAEMNKNTRPCLMALYNKGLFKVRATTNYGDVYVINGKEYYTIRFGIYQVDTNQEFKC
jgi:hypothetical protein